MTDKVKVNLYINKSDADYFKLLLAEDKRNTNGYIFEQLVKSHKSEKARLEN